VAASLWEAQRPCVSHARVASPTGRRLQSGLSDLRIEASSLSHFLRRLGYIGSKRCVAIFALRAFEVGSEIARFLGTATCAGPPVRRAATKACTPASRRARVACIRPLVAKPSKMFHVAFIPTTPP